MRFEPARHEPALHPVHTLLRSRLFSSALLAAVLISGCGETDEPDGVVTPPPVGTNNGSALPGANPTTQPVGANPTQPSNPSGPSTPSLPSDAGVVATQPSGSTDTPWCKVKAILDRKCVSCHTTPSVGGAPFPLTKYAELVAPHPSKPGKKIYERVGVRVHADLSQAEKLNVMPPGAQLPAADLSVIDSWVAAGAPAGDNPTCVSATGVPPATADAGTSSTEWPLKECDAVYKIVSHGAGGVTTPTMAPPGQESHPQIAWDAPWGDEQVQAIAFKSITDNKAVLHHWILSGRPGGFLTGWAPGEDGIKKMRDDVGMMMPTGKGSLNLDMHYYNTMGTKAEPDNSGVEVCVVKQAHFRKNHAGVATSLTPFLFNIPANSTNYETKASCKFSGTAPITLLSASPHAHKLAVRMIFTLRRASGEVVKLHDMPFMFGEQKSYPLDPPVVVQPGDTIDTTCVYNNPSNRAVSFGESTNNEMCFNFALYYPAGGLKCGGATTSGAGGVFGGAL